MVDEHETVLGERVATARQQLELHRRVYVPEPVCNRCLTPYPCDDVVRSMRALRRADVERPDA